MACPDGHATVRTVQAPPRVRRGRRSRRPHRPARFEQVSSFSQQTRSPDSALGLRAGTNVPRSCREWSPRRLVGAIQRVIFVLVRVNARSRYCCLASIQRPARGRSALSSIYDQGKAALDELIEWAEEYASGESRNEATTRLHLIDTLLTDVLKWPKSSIRAEEPADSGRIDYALGSPGTQFIIEAKREGIYFDLPAGMSSGVYNIENISSGEKGRPLRDALKQAAGYAASNGVAPAGVTNGHQFVFFIAARTDGVPPLKGKALAFPSLTDMRTEFRLLWDNASQYGVDKKIFIEPLICAKPLHPSRYPFTFRTTLDRNAGTACNQAWTSWENSFLLM